MSLPCLCIHSTLYPDGREYCELVPDCGKLADRTIIKKCNYLVPGIGKMKTMRELQAERYEEEKINSKVTKTKVKPIMHVKKTNNGQGSML